MCLSSRFTVTTFIYQKLSSARLYLYEMHLNNETTVFFGIISQKIVFCFCEGPMEEQGAAIQQKKEELEATGCSLSAR